MTTNYSTVVQNQQFGQQVVTLNSATAADPFMSILGRPGIAPNAGLGMNTQGQSFNSGQVFNPESAYAGGVHTGNFNAANNAAIAQAEANAAVTGAALGAAGNIGRGFAGRPT